MKRNGVLGEAGYVLGVMGLLFSLAGVADDEQTVTISSLVSGATCDVELDKTSAIFNSIVPQTFTQQSSWQTTGEVIRVMLSLTDCIAPGPGDPAFDATPSVQVTGDYGQCGDVAYGCWRAGSAVSDVGFLLAFGDYRRLSGQKTGFYQQVTQDGNLVEGDGWVALAASGGIAEDGQRYPFSLAMTCGACQSVATLGETHAAMTFTFSYK